MLRHSSATSTSSVHHLHLKYSVCFQAYSSPLIHYTVFLLWNCDVYRKMLTDDITLCGIIIFVQRAVRWKCRFVYKKMCINITKPLESFDFRGFCQCVSKLITLENDDFRSLTDMSDGVLWSRRVGFRNILPLTALYRICCE